MNGLGHDEKFEEAEDFLVSPIMRKIESKVSTPTKMNTKDKLIKLEPMPVESEYASSKQRISSTVRNTEEIVLTDHYLQNKGYSKLQLQDKKNILELLKNEHETLTTRLRIIEFSISDINTN